MPRWSSAAGAVRLKRAGHAATGVSSGPGPENAGSRLFAAEGGHGDRRGSAGVGPGAVGGVQVSGGRAAGVEEVRRAAPGPFDDLEVIRVDAGMSTSRFCRLVDMPERTWRRWQARAHAGAPVRGPWPTPTSTAVTAAVVAHAEAHPAWGHRKVWAMCRYGGQQVSPATVLRIMRGRGLLLAADYQAERRQLAAARRAVFVTPPDRPNRVWQLDFPRVRDHRRRDVADRRVHRLLQQVRARLASVPDRDQHDAVAAIEAAIGEAQRLVARCASRSPTRSPGRSGR